MLCFTHGDVVLADRVLPDGSVTVDGGRITAVVARSGDRATTANHILSIDRAPSHAL